MKITNLSHGAHPNREDGVCFTEAAAWLGGEEHTDHPECVSRVLAAFGRSWNDTLDDEPRNRLLLPLLPDLVGTGLLSPEQEHELSLTVLDWYIRHWLPAWLDLVPSLAEHAITLRGLGPVSDANASDVGKLVWSAGAAAGAAARDAAGAAARAAAGDAAWAAAGAAAGAAAWDAARAAAGAAAGDAAGAAAGAAARDAAGAAARAAAGDAAGAYLEPTVTKLQADAVDLLTGLCASAKAMRLEAE